MARIIPSSSRSSSSSITRCLATSSSKSQKASKKDNDDNTSSLSYMERKQAAKEARIRQYQESLARAEQVKHRRDGTPQHVLKGAFQEWFQRRVQKDDMWNRRQRQSQGQKGEWKIQVAAVLERLPQVLEDPTDFETNFDELQTYLAQFGKDYPPEFSGPPSTIAISNEELLEHLPEGFTPAPRETAADASGDTTTLDRKLKERVYLLVDGAFPTCQVQDDDDGNDSLVEAALRAIRDDAGQTKLDVYAPSAAPIGVQLNPHEQPTDKYFGTKTFFVKVQLDDDDDGNMSVANQKVIVKKGGGLVEWLTRQEIVERMEQQQKQKHDDDDNDNAKFFHYLL